MAALERHQSTHDIFLIYQKYQKYPMISRFHARNAGVSAGCPETSEDDRRPIVTLDMRTLEFSVAWWPCRTKHRGSYHHEDRLGELAIMEI